MEVSLMPTSPSIVIPANAGIHFDFAGDSLHVRRIKMAPSVRWEDDPGYRFAIS